MAVNTRGEKGGRKGNGGGEGGRLRFHAGRG